MRVVASPHGSRFLRFAALGDSTTVGIGDLATRPELHQRDCWSIDRLHPSERGHRALARAFGERLVARGYGPDLPGAAPEGGLPPSWRRDLGWMVAKGAPWCGRRARDLGPWVARRAWAEVRGVPVG